MLTRYVSFLWQVQEGEAAHFLAEATGAAPRRAAGAVTAAVRAPHGLEVLLETELHASQLAKSSMSEAEGVLSSGAEPRAPPAFARVPALLKQILDKQNAPRAAPPVQPSVAPMFVASSGQPPAPVPELPPFRGPLSAALLKITTPGDDQLDPPLRAPEPAHFTARATGDFLPQARAPPVEVLPAEALERLLDSESPSLERPWGAAVWQDLGAPPASAAPSAPATAAARGGSRSGKGAAADTAAGKAAASLGKAGGARSGPPRVLKAGARADEADSLAHFFPGAARPRGTRSKSRAARVAPVPGVLATLLEEGGGVGVHPFLVPKSWESKAAWDRATAGGGGRFGGVPTAREPAALLAMVKALPKKLPKGTRTKARAATGTKARAATGTKARAATGTKARAATGTKTRAATGTKTRAATGTKTRAATGTKTRASSVAAGGFFAAVGGETRTKAAASAPAESPYPAAMAQHVASLQDSSTQKPLEVSHPCPALDRGRCSVAAAQQLPHWCSRLPGDPVNALRRAPQVGSSPAEQPVPSALAAYLELTAQDGVAPIMGKTRKTVRAAGSCEAERHSGACCIAGSDCAQRVTLKTTGRHGGSSGYYFSSR